MKWGFLISIIIASTALLGNYLGIERLARWCSESNMRLITAWGIIAIACQLSTVQFYKRISRAIGIGFLVSFAVIMSVHGVKIPSPGTVLCLYLFASYGLIASVKPDSSIDNKLIGVTVGALASLAMIGHVFGIPGFYYSGRYSNGMAVNTATCLLVMAWCVNSGKGNFIFKKNRERKTTLEQVEEHCSVNVPAMACRTRMGGTFLSVPAMIVLLAAVFIAGGEYRGRVMHSPVMGVEVTQVKRDAPIDSKLVELREHPSLPVVVWFRTRSIPSDRMDEAIVAMVSASKSSDKDTANAAKCALTAWGVKCLIK